MASCGIFFPSLVLVGSGGGGGVGTLAKLANDVTQTGQTSLNGRRSG